MLEALFGYPVFWSYVYTSDHVAATQSLRLPQHPRADQFFKSIFQLRIFSSTSVFYNYFSDFKFLTPIFQLTIIFLTPIFQIKVFSQTPIFPPIFSDLKFSAIYLNLLNRIFEKLCQKIVAKDCWKINTAEGQLRSQRSNFRLWVHWTDQLRPFQKLRAKSREFCSRISPLLGLDYLFKVINRANRVLRCCELRKFCTGK